MTILFDSRVSRKVAPARPIAAGVPETDEQMAFRHAFNAMFPPTSRRGRGRPDQPPIHDETDELWWAEESDRLTRNAALLGCLPRGFAESLAMAGHLD